jgi:fused-like protein
MEEFVVKDLFYSGGLEFITLNGGLSLSPINKYEAILTDNLLILTQTCKLSKEFYPGIELLDPFNDLTRILQGPNEFLKIKVCNLVGQMCKHSDYFYRHLQQSGVFSEMIKLCDYQDIVLKKAISFAIGNAAYYSDYLYNDLVPFIFYIVRLLSDQDDRVKTNSIGTISNLTRNSNSLVGEIINNDVPAIFMDLFLYDSSLTVKKLVIHAFKNFFKHKHIVSALKSVLSGTKREDFLILHEDPSLKSLSKHIKTVQQYLLSK